MLRTGGGFTYCEDTITVSGHYTVGLGDVFTEPKDSLVVVMYFRTAAGLAWNAFARFKDL